MEASSLLRTLGSNEAMTIEFEPGQRRRLQTIVDHWQAEMLDVRAIGSNALCAVIRKR